MRILVITQYFWPESFKINDLCLALKERGHEVAVLTGKPNYPQGTFSEGYGFFSKRIEIWNDIKIYRSPIIPRGKGSGSKLFINYFSFAIFASFRLLFIRDKFDKIFIFQTSPITVGIPGIIAKFRFGAPVYFWVQDLWPESVSAAGGLNNKFILYSLNLLTKFIYHNCTKIMVQSKAFIPYIINQKVNFAKIVYYPNSTEIFYRVLDVDVKLLNTLPIGVKLMFAGNIGQAQSFQTLLEAAFTLKKQNILVQWLILGDGRMRNFVAKKIVELNLQDNFHLLGSFATTEMPKYYSCADAMIVSLKKEKIFALTIPSKIQSYLASGKPIIASLEGEGARIIEESQSGFTCPPEDSLELVRIIKQFLLLSKIERHRLGVNGRSYFDKEFEREFLTNKLEDIFVS